MLHELWTRKSLSLWVITEAYLRTTFHLVNMSKEYPKVKSVCINDLTDWRKELGRRVGGMP